MVRRPREALHEPTKDHVRARRRDGPVTSGWCLAARITPTGRGVDALACLDAAVDEAERVLGLDDLRDDRGERGLVDENTGEVIDVVPAPIAVVSEAR